MTSPHAPGAAARSLPLAAQAALVLGGALALTLSAKVQIPFWPVPMTLQTLAVMAIALSVPPRLAVAAMLAYLAAGAAGLPVFAGSPARGVGLAYMAGPTGGYLAGYLAAMALTSRLAAGRGVVGRTGAMLAGLALVYALGLAWLAVYVPARALLAQGFAPFILGDLVKIACVAVLSCCVPPRAEAGR
ncbi:biotin transporter BioY [Azorhizobium doebereinerae]|uniref:biotin transporter BioY n=1 Tax=Azorhizobium doebereinerae TaxID=281091 RepID=UPI000410EF30|nr:biotin transporter BioY [Azorhizobium doebereinerae]